MPIERPSPNHGERRPGKPIDMLVLHYTGMKSAAAALARLCDPGAQVSAHYLIDEHGLVYRLVPEERRAWHAGVGQWAGETDVNSRSIGIELANPGHEHGYRDFPPAQIDALAALARIILARHPIPAHRVLGHSDVAPARKTDPGERFPWARLATQGIGLWPAGGTAAAPAAPVDIARLQRDLAAFGYALEPTGAADAPTQTVVAAFQRHFRPARVDGVPDPETAAVLRQIARAAAAIA
ncbi:MAG: N-acetylmuramoyl-L-alanine amidase [Rhodospirillales bacterium]|nr:N-acetylmuramoyl-L-alanine amidase [Rhodospirillales bacterium]